MKRIEYIMSTGTQWINTGIVMQARNKNRSRHILK